MCEITEILGGFAGGYLIGSIPIGYLLVRAKRGTDVRDIGSGSIGATNVSRVLGKKTAVIVAVLDAVKGICAFFLARLIIQVDLGIELAAIGAVIGHCFPVWIGFKGGKGVSTSLGTAIVLATLPALLAFAMFTFTIAIVRRVSAASVTAVWLFAGLVFLLDFSIQMQIMGIFLALFITFTHRQNIKRLLEGEEKPLFGNT